MQEEKATRRGPETDIYVAIAILVSGWVFEYLVVALTHKYLRDLKSSLFGAPFWPIIFLWLRIRSRFALTLSLLVTFAGVGFSYWLIDLRSDAQAGIALAALLALATFVGVCTFGFGLLLRRPHA